MNHNEMDVTIVIPTYNRSAAVLETLNILSVIDYPHDAWEVVIVDDGSTDDTETSVREWLEHKSFQAQYLRQENAGAAAARNRGAWAARGEVLIFIDNDILVQPDFIQQHLRALKENPACWIMGRVIHPPELRQTPFGRFRDDFHESFYRNCLHDCLSETQGMTGQNVSIPKSDFLSLGGFDESYPGASCEDWELAMRARQRGTRVLFHPGICVLHNDWAVSLEQFCRRQKLYSIPQVLLWKKYGEASPWAQLVSENAPVDWRRDAWRLSIKKMCKRLCASDRSEWLIQCLSYLIERFLPDSASSHRAYKAATAIAIFRGVRQGLQQYASTVTPPPTTLPVRETQ